VKQFEPSLCYLSGVCSLVTLGLAIALAVAPVLTIILVFTVILLRSQDSARSPRVQHSNCSTARRVFLTVRWRSTGHSHS